MASFKLVLKPSVEKDLRSVPKSTLQRIMTRIEALAEDPFPRQSAKLTGVERLYRLRVGDYRIVYAFIAKREQLLSTTSDIAEKHTAVCDEVSPGKERLESVCSILLRAFWPS